MNIFLSYGHDTNAPLIERIKDYLSTDENGKPRHKVWIDTSEIKEGQDWRRSITDGILKSDIVLAGLSKHSTRTPGVCRDEISISIGVKGGNIKTILLEPSDEVAPPAMISHIQWLDMSDWRDHEKEGWDSDYFQKKFLQIVKLVETPENEQFDGEITTLKDALEPILSISRIRSLTQSDMCGREWLYDKIVEWDETSSQRIFWIMAGPGFGKSVFAANLQQRYNARIPAVQFVEWGKPDHSNPCRILKNIAFQLAVRFPEYRKFVLQLPDVINKKMNEKNEDELFDMLLCESTWMKIDGGQENVWVLIDALDEANGEDGNKISQTLARHMDRMPRWLKFIITSRDDSKVRLPLQNYQPQVLDLEDYVNAQNKEDMLLYLHRELNGMHPSEEQIAQIMQKSQGVFLYLSLCVNGVVEGTYSLDKLDKLPNGMNGYYFEFFTRQFGNDISKYKTEVAPILQLMIASRKNMRLSFLQYLLNTTESTFYDAVASLEHVCRISDENNDETMTFFHHSVENWLTNYKTAGPYFISRKDGNKLFADRFLNWLHSTIKEEEDVWDYYPYGLSHLAEANYVIPQNADRDKMATVFNELQYNGGLGAFSKYHSGGRDSALDYCKMLLSNGKEKDFLHLMIDFFEFVKDDYIKIGIVGQDTRTLEIKEIPFNPTALFHATLNAGSLAFLIKEVCTSCSLHSYETIAVLMRIIEVIGMYDVVLLDPYDDIPSNVFYDLSDCCYLEMRKIVAMLEEVKSKFALPCAHDEVISYDGNLYCKALAERHPEWYSQHAPSPPRNIHQ